MHSDILIIGGGLVGTAIAIGLQRRHCLVTVLDGGDTDVRASRGNFGLTWVQGKGADNAAYALWTGAAARAWPEFAAELKDATGVDIELQQNGGLDYCLTDLEFEQRLQIMRRVQQHTHGAFEYQMLDNHELRELVPQVSAAVTGASFSPQDGHVNPLKLLQALHIQLQQLGSRLQRSRKGKTAANYYPNASVTAIEATPAGFTLTTTAGQFTAERLVLAAGLANTTLASQIGMQIPLKPNQGQVLVTERVAPFLKYPSIHIRQTDEGTLQIGDSHADIGVNESTDIDILSAISARLLNIFPHLRDINVLRTWAALRVMTPDGLPVYQRSIEWPNAYAVNCHSGVTLAAQHATVLADWIASSQDADAYKPTSTGNTVVPGADLIADFSAERFRVSNYPAQ